LLLFALDTPAAGEPENASGRTVGAVGEHALFQVPDEPSSLILRATSGATYRIRFRTAGRWSEPIDLVATTTESPDDSDPAAAFALGPVRVAAGADQVEITVTGGQSPVVEPTFLLDVDPPAGAEDAGPAPTVAGSQQVKPGQRPAIMPRSAWATEGWAFNTDGCEEGPSYAANVQAVVVHHTVTSNSYSQDDVDDLLRAIYYAHVKVNGWCDIGYNFVVDRFGTIWEARSGGAERPVVGGHAKGFNTGTAGIALLGQHHPGASPRAASPSAEAEAAVQALAGWKLGIHGVDPTGTTWLKNRSSRGAQRLTSGRWHLVPTVLGHRDVGTTACPGNHGIAMAARLPDRLAPIHPGATPYAWQSWQPARIGTGFVVLDSSGQTRPAGTATVPGIGAPPGSSSQVAPTAAVTAVAAQPGSSGGASGYTLAGDGVVTAFGGAAPVAAPALRSPAVDLALGPSGGWVITADGSIVGFGGRPGIRPEAGSGEAVIAGDLDTEGNGYLLETGGRLRPVGSAPAASLALGNPALGNPALGNAPVDIAVRPQVGASGWGGWVVDTAGDLHPFGDAPPVELTAPRRPGGDLAITAVVASASGHGGWVLTSDGQLWPFGHERLVLPATTLPRAVGRGGVDVATLPPIVDIDIANTATGRYLAALVELFLDRPATAADLDHWHARLTFDPGPPSGRRAVSVGLARSDEWAGQRVDGLYRDVLGRPADDDGRRYWVDAIAGGLRLERVGVYFYGSAEYVAASGSTERYVDRLYQALLDRPSDPAGRRYWVDLLTTGRAAPPDVAAGFYASVESRRGRVRALYKDVLGREPDEAGLEYWTGRLVHVDDILLAAELAASDELYDRHR
jgi:hypothetical protein